MTPAHAFALLPLVLAMAMAAGSARASTPLLPGQFQAYVEDGRMDFHRAPQALAQFDALFAAAGEPAAIPEATLSKLANDAAIANFYYGGARVDAHAAVFSQLVLRKAATALQVEDMHRSLIAGRRWQDAAALAARHPDVPLEAMPAHVVAGEEGAPGLHYWRFDPDEDRLVRETLAMAGGVTLVVVSSPGCHFSRDAMRALENNPQLDQILPRRRLFLAPAIASLELKSLAAWNASHPQFQHVLVDRPQAWSFVRKWNTPQFFFLVDGAPVAWVEGWPEEGQVQALMEASRSTLVP